MLHVMIFQNMDVFGDGFGPFNEEFTADLCSQYGGTCEENVDDGVLMLRQLITIQMQT